MLAREPREPDTAEDAGGQTDHLGQAYKRWLEEELVLPQAPVFHEFLESIFSNLQSPFWTESSILAQDERWRRA